MFNKYFFSALVVFIAAIFLFLTNLIYTLTLEDAKKNHQMQQLEMAKVVAEGTRYFLYHLVKDMELLTGKVEENPQTPRFKDLIEDFRNNYDQKIISSIIVTGNKSSPDYFSGNEPPQWVYQQLPELLKNSSGIPDKYSFLASDVFPENQNDLHSVKSFLIVFSLNTGSGKTEHKYVAFLVNFDSLIKQFIIPLKLSSNDFVWILDGNGRLIYHPKHQEMLFNSIFNLQDDCLSCHKSFHDQIKIVKSAGPAYGEYWVQGDEPSKIFAYVPLQLENQRWNIAISTLLPDVISGLKERFRLFFILGAFILITLISSVFLVYYFNMRRIKSEEEKKNLEKLREYQEQLNHSSKLASIGELVDSVAHEINTPMGIISAHADSIILGEDPDPGIKEELEIIKKQTRRVSDYTRSLLNFSRRMPFKPEEIDAVSLVDESIYLLNPRFREKKIKLLKEFSSKNIIICADRRQLEQVLINVLNNAIDAINFGGEIKIGIKEKIRRHKILSSTPKEYVKISIADNGTGIKKSELNKIFDPFFTTKINTGTGLGLSIAKSIIQRHRGVIEVESKENKGTVFSIILPREGSLTDEQ